MTKRLQAIGWPLAAIVVAVALPASASEPARGRSVFDAQKCSLCHSVSTVGIECKSEKMFASDLVDLAKRRDASWMVAYLKKEQDIEGKQHKREFKGSDEELQALVDWLLEQKSE